MSEIAAAGTVLMGLATKYGATAAGAIIRGLQSWATSRRFTRIESILEHVNRKADAYALPSGFEEAEDFQDFAAAVLEIGLRTTSEQKRAVLAQFLLTEPRHGQTVNVDAKTKILELLPHLQPHHLELLTKISAASGQVNQLPPKLQDWEASLRSLEHLDTSDRMDLFYGAASDLLRWFLIRSTPGASGVNVGAVASFIPGSSNMGQVRITRLGEHMLGYIRDPNGHFIDFSSLGRESGGNSGANEEPA